MMRFSSIAEVVEVANLARLGSNDPHTKVGAVLIVPDRSPGAPFGAWVVATQGFNWIVAAGPESFERPLKYDHVIHAECMAIGAAAQVGIPLQGAAIFTTHPPCKECAKLIRAGGISTVILGDEDYSSNTAENKAAAAHLLHGLRVQHHSEVKRL